MFPCLDWIAEKRLSGFCQSVTLSIIQQFLKLQGAHANPLLTGKCENRIRYCIRSDNHKRTM